jgi:tRNA(Ile)-lysidine synthase
MPLLREENPKIAENLSQMALSLRQDEAALAKMAEFESLPDIFTLRSSPEAVRRRMLEQFLKNCGVREPEREHILLAEQLVFSEKPSAKALFPQGITLCRNYDRLEQDVSLAPLAPTPLHVNSCVELETLGLRVYCENAEKITNTDHIFTVTPVGTILLRSRQEGDRIRLFGGQKSLKKLFIDRKIPAGRRPALPVVCDDNGILGVYGIGADCSRMAQQLPALQIRFEQIDNSHRL